MDIGLDIQDVVRLINFSTDESADNAGQAIAQTVADNTTIDLTDDRGRRIIVSAKVLSYAIIGSETKHAIGLGTL